MTITNPATSSELRDIADILDDLNTLDEKLRVKKADVSLGVVSVFDSNGDILGHLVSQDGLYVFIAEEEPEEAAVAVFAPQDTFASQVAEILSPEWKNGAKSSSGRARLAAIEALVGAE